MKQLIVLISLVAVGSLISCNKKELEENNRFIVGVWEANFETLAGCDDPGMDIQGEIECTETDCIRYTFQDDGVYFSEITIEGETFGEQGTYSLDIDNLSLCIEDEGIVTCNGGSYDVNSATLQFTITDTDSGCSISRVFEKTETSS